MKKGSSNPFRDESIQLMNSFVKKISHDSFPFSSFIEDDSSKFSIITKEGCANHHEFIFHKEEWNFFFQAQLKLKKREKLNPTLNLN